MKTQLSITLVFTKCLLLLSVDLSLGLVNGVCTYRKWSRPGTLKLLVIAGIHGNSKGRCDGISTTNFPLVIALNWILDVLNGNRSNSLPYLPNITLGYDVYDNCDDEDRTFDLLYPGFTKSYSNCTGQIDNSSDQIYPAIYSLTSPESTHVISRLAGSLPVLRVREPTPKLSSSLQPNLIQTVASYEDEVEALVKFLVEMRWNFVFLVHTDDEYGINTMETILSKSRENQICIHLVKALKIKHVKPSETEESAKEILNEIYKQISRGYHKSIAILYLGYERGAVYLLEVQKRLNKPVGSEITWLFSQGVGFAFSVANRIGYPQNYGLSVIQKAHGYADFKNYLHSVLMTDTETAFDGLKSEYLSAVDCDIKQIDSCHNVNNTNFNFISSLVDSLLLTVSMLKELHVKSCQIEGLCLNMLQKLKEGSWYLLPKLLNLKSTFSTNYLPEEYQMYNRTLQFTDSQHIELSDDMPLQILALDNASHKIAEYDGNKLSIVGDTSTFPTSACNLPEDCSICHLHLDLRYSYLHGDVLLLGLFSVHTYGNTPFQCGQVRHDTNDVITVSAFMESIKAARLKTGIAFGGIAIDDCYSAFNTSAFLSDLFSKKTILRDHVSGIIIDFDKVVVIIGALSSPVSLVIGDLATAQGIPMISYGASSPELDNAARYPLFLRTVPSDTRQANGIVKLIQHLNVSYVGALYIDDAYGKNGMKAVLAEAKALGICIIDPIAVSQDADNTTIENIITTLYLQETRVIVYFSIDSMALRMLSILSTKFSDRKPLVFIASEAWGTNTKIIEGSLGQKAKGSLVFNLETLAQDNLEYRNFLLNLNSSQSDNNRWLPLYFEDIYDCDFISSFDKSHASADPCKPFRKLEENTAERLYQDQRGVHVIHAVEAATLGYTDVVSGICGHVLVCPKVRKNGPALKKAIQKIKLGKNGVSPFDVSGSGNIGFTIVNIQRNDETGMILYVKIGSFNKRDNLKLTSDPVFYNDLQQPSSLHDMFPENLQCSLFKDRCSDICHTDTQSTQTPTDVTTETATTDDGNGSATLVTTVVLAVIVAILVIALIFIIVILLRRQTHHISDETFKKSQSLSSQVFASNTNIYNEVIDYPTSDFTSGGPVQYADIRQTLTADKQLAYPEPRSELLSTVSTKSLSPGMSRPSKPFVEHTRSNSDSRILENSVGMALSPHHLPGFLLPNTRSKGLENLNEINYNQNFVDSNFVNFEKNRFPSSESSYNDNEHEDSGAGLQADLKPKVETLNYITAKDLIGHSDEEEDVDDSFSDENGSASKAIDNQYRPGISSQSDNEDEVIDFPAKETVSYLSYTKAPYINNSCVVDKAVVSESRSNNTAIENSEVKNEILGTKTGRKYDGSRNQSKSSMSSAVPDIIPFDADERRGAAFDSDEQEVFII